LIVCRRQPLHRCRARSRGRARPNQHRRPRDEEGSGFYAM